MILAAIEILILVQCRTRNRGVLESVLIRLLAYQYRDLHDPEYDPQKCEKFLHFIEELGLSRKQILGEESKKVIKFSYPDLYRHNPSHAQRDVILKRLNPKFTGVTVKDVYIVYAKQNAPHIGFTASVVFSMEVDDPSGATIGDIFVPPKNSRSSRFHDQFESAWVEVADDRKTLPVVLFISDENESMLWDTAASTAARFFGSSVSVSLPSGRSVRLERGFPYVSYAIHAEIESVMPEEIHSSDFAMLMALPGFVESKLEAVRHYRKKLVEVQKTLEEDNFPEAEKKYNQAWRDFERVQGLAPTTTAAAQRILQKYPGDSVFALIAEDNSELIQFTVTAAIGATDQVRSNIQSFAQQKLQVTYNDLQQSLVGLTASTRDLQRDSVKLTRSIRTASFWTALATIVLAIGSVWVLKKTPEMQIVGTQQKPIHVIADAPPKPGGGPVPLKILPELKGSKKKGKLTVLTLTPYGPTDLVGEVPTPEAVVGIMPLEVAILREDGTVVARSSIVPDKITRAVRFAADKNLFVGGQQFYVQASQRNVWSLKLPLRNGAD